MSHGLVKTDMSRRIAALVVMGITVGIGTAYAQESKVNSGPGLVEVTYMPAGAAFFTSEGDAPSFGNYGFGTAVTFNINRVIGVEGEIGSMIATTSDLQFGDLRSDTKAPNMLSYTANVVVSPWTGHSVVPYATGGIGGLTMFERPALGITSDETFLSGNVGGGVKWYAPNNRWGLRGEYRFGATKSKDDAPEFFGRETRYVHRIYAAVVINTVR
jgi:opacity protein-like surface antigen